MRRPDAEPVGGSAPRYMPAAQLFALLDSVETPDREHSAAVDELERRREWLRDSMD